MKRYKNMEISFYDYFTTSYKNKLLFLIAFGSGSAGTLAFSPYDCWPAAIVSLVGLLTVILYCAPNKASKMGFLWGIGLFGTGIHWIYISIMQFGSIPRFLGILVVGVLIIYLSLYPTFFSFLLKRLWNCASLNLRHLTLGAPALWSTTEFLRSKILSGFPWLEFGYSQIDGPLKWVAPILGVQAITFLLVMTSGFIVFIFSRRYLFCIPIVLLLLVPWPFFSSLKWYQAQKERITSIALIQGNIPQTKMWSPDQSNLALNTYIHYTCPVLGKVQIVIWPESAIPGDEISQNKFLTDLDMLLRKKHTSLVAGIIGVQPVFPLSYNYYNSILVLGQKTPYHFLSKDRYDKHHLVPFGEGLELNKIVVQIFSAIFNLPSVVLSQGKYLQPQLQVMNIKFTAAICYEVILGSQVRDNFRFDTDFLLAVSNDAWFGSSIGPDQHFQMARMRSLELGRPLLHGSNNGITAVVSPDGTILARLERFKRETLIVQVTPTRGVTPYALFGSWPFLFIVVLSGITALVVRR